MKNRGVIITNFVIVGAIVALITWVYIKLRDALIDF